MTTLEEKAQQVEKLIKRIESRLDGRYITEEQWQFVVDRLTALEKRNNRRPGQESLTDKIKQSLRDNPQGLATQEIADITGGIKSSINGILFYLLSRKTIKSEALGNNRKNGCRYFYNSTHTNN